MLFLFLITIFLLIWFYLGYPLLLALLAKLTAMINGKNRLAYQSEYQPNITIIIIAHNEEEKIGKRIRNCLSLDYPREKVEIIVASDASTDSTVDKANSFGNKVKVVNAKIRNKTRTRNLAVEKAKGEIIFFTDANTLYGPDCINKMVKSYKNPEVGCVGGELKVYSSEKDVIEAGHGIYWRWEYALRRWQSDIGILTKASGANMSIRKELYKPPPHHIDIDQAAGPMVIKQGYQVVHEPEAIAYENYPTSLRGELFTRRRLTIRALTALKYYSELLNPLKHPWIASNLISYRLLRYLVPFLLLGAFTSNGFLMRSGGFYKITFALQGLLYLLSSAGYLLEKSGNTFWLFSWPFAFCWFNLGILIGDIEFLLGKRIKAYESISIF